MHGHCVEDKFEATVVTPTDHRIGAKGNSGILQISSVMDAGYFDVGHKCYLIAHFAQAL
jgi:hypothetical protein